MTMKRILVTGGSGLVGKAIQKYINQHSTHDEWNFLSSKDGDLRNRQETLNIFQKYKPTHVVHLAAMVGGLYKNEAKKVQMFTDNVRINENVMEASNLWGVDRGVFTLSNCLFPSNITEDQFPIDETMIHDGPVHVSYEGYAYAKRMMEIQCKNYNKYHNRKYVCILPVNIYGEEDNFNLDDCHLIPALIHKCYMAKQTNSDFNIWGTGKPMRQFLYSTDLADIIYRLISDDNETDSFLCLSEENEYQVSDLATIIADLFDFKGNIVYDTTKSDGCLRKPVTNLRMRQNFLFHDYHGTSLENGLKNTILWFVAHYENIRK
jgi:GDP-L-fucose synthase